MQELVEVGASHVGLPMWLKPEWD